MPAENAYCSVAMPPPNVFHVDMVNTIGESANKLDVIDTLIAKVRWIVVEAKPFVSINGFDGTFGRGDIESDLSWMDF